MVSSSQACPICLTSTAIKPVSPCAHSICLSCALRLSTPTCPLCRSLITSVRSPISPTHPLPALLTLRKSLATQNISSVPQFLILSPSPASNSTLISHLLALHPLRPSHRPRPRSPSHSLITTLAPPPFTPNASLPTPSRITSHTLPLSPCPQQASNTLATILALRPSFLLLTCSLNSLDAFTALASWDRAIIRAPWGASGPPPRFFVFLDAGLSGAGGRVDKAALGAAMAKLNIADRPKTTTVIRTGARAKRGVFGGSDDVRRLAKRALFYARLPKESVEPMSEERVVCLRALRGEDGVHGPAEEEAGSPVSGAGDGDGFFGE